MRYGLKRLYIISILIIITVYPYSVNTTYTDSDSLIEKIGYIYILSSWVIAVRRTMLINQYFAMNFPMRD